ncbi:HEXXH motif domain-containing protein [Actinospica robiniae]|uniref:HEXXH motif domain-containing protein n=1 Tax=Actinospica robiniae TaxID=304901 RepID=UPI000553B4AE|nr:HEXXH motif domain-containing protein [Actinospica robiniae]
MIPNEYFAELSAGRGGPEAVRFLWRTERSRRLLLLAALFDEAEREPRLVDGLPAVAEARRLFATAQKIAPAATDEVLLHPEVGAWVAYTMRRRADFGLRAGVPPCVDFGGLHVLALVAAARAGLSWRTRVPLRLGGVMLFGLGMARFTGTGSGDAEDEFVDAVTEGGRILLTTRGVTVEACHGPTVDARVGRPSDCSPDDRGEGSWWGLHSFQSKREPALTACLDDIDPLRDLADPVPPARLSPDQVELWWSLLDDAWTLLCDHHPESAAEIASGLVSVAPLPMGDLRETRSASSGESFGCMMVSRPFDAATMAVSIVHEFQHIKLGGLMHLVQLTEDDESAALYAPWRDDPRPLGGLLQGAYAFFGIAGFWREHRKTVSDAELRQADFEYAYARGQAWEGLATILASGGLTAAGREFSAGLAARLETWQSEPVDPVSASAASIAADHHRVGWRIRHQRVRAEDAELLAEAWLADRSLAVLPDSRPEVRPAVPERWSQDMMGLIRRSVAVPESLHRVTAEKTAGAPRVPAPRRAADVALVLGSSQEALEGYTAALHDDCKDVDAWCGLALCLDAAGHRTGARLLAQRPELVQAVYARVAQETGAAPDAIELVEWLASGSTAA